MSRAGRFSFTPLAPLSKTGRVLRSLIIVMLLLGSLFPAIGGVSLALVGTVLATPVILYEVFRWLPRVHPVVAVLPFFVFVGLHALNMPPTNDYGADKFEKWFSVTLVSAAAACLLRDKKATQTFGNVWIMATSVLAVITIAGYDGGRADVFGANPIWLARAFATGIVIAVWMWWQKAASPWLALISVVTLGGGLVASGSRGPVLGVIVGVVILAMFAGRGRVGRILAIGVCGIGAIWAVQVLPFFAGNRFATIATQGADDAVRNTYWSLTFDIIREYPEGVGLGNWSAAAGNTRHLWPHNLFLEVLSESGVVIGTGVILVVALITVLLFSRAVRDPISLLVFSALAVELVGVNVSGDLNARTFWFLLTLGFLCVTRAVIDTPTGTPAPSKASAAPAR